MTKKIMLKLQIGILLVAVFSLNACSTKKESDKVADAQACLNNSTQTTALECTSKVDGLDSPGANTIRCAAIFIRQGFSDPAFVAQAANQIKSGSGTSTTTTVMATFKFSALSTITENYAQSQQALSFCSLSGSKGMMFLATAASLSTTTSYLSATVAGCTAFTDTAQQLTCLKSQNSATANTAVGSVVASAYNSNCTGTQQGANQEFCTQFTAATAACAPTDQECIGRTFLSKY